MDHGISEHNTRARDMMRGEENMAAAAVDMANGSPMLRRITEMPTRSAGTKAKENAPLETVADSSTFADH